ncbi:MAG TPA: GAF domain-containing sensor histidine kinase [Thermomicrobiales bacterium]|nr:GAF domain-containing sensor histidine kinase [Thermomicrobiales bacterium]
MAMSAVHRSFFPGFRIWLAHNRLAAAWLLAAVVITVAGAKGAPELYRQTVALVDIPAGDRDELRRSLASLHLTPAHLFWFQAIANALTIIVNLTIGWLLIRRAPRTGFAIYLAFVLLALTQANYPPSIDDLLPGQPIAQLIIRLTTVVAISGFFTLPFVFPDGRFVPRWTIAWGVFNVYSVASFAFFPSWDIPGTSGTWVEAVTTGAQLLSMLFAVVYRYRKVSTPEQRRQTRWVMLGMMIGVPGFFAGDAMMRNIDASPAGVACLLGFIFVMPVLTAAPVVALGIAILHYRLFDIDVVLSRTLVWMAMTAIVIGTYIGVVVGVGSMLGSRRSLLLSLLATGVVAVAFQPVRLRVQRGVDRLLFGERDDPYAVLARLGHRIEDSLSAAELLPQIVRTTAEALRLPYAALFLERAEGPELVAAAGVASASTLRLPLTYQGQAVGALEVATRVPGEVFSPADRRLLEDLARHVGVAARTVSLAAELQHSRERIVTSREEERRRLRRDLHDGLGAQLAALIMEAGAARRLVRTDADAAERAILDLREELRAAVAEVRRLVLGLRPPALDELGLVGALRARLARLDQEDGDGGTPLRVRFDADDQLPPLSAATEVAAFRIVEEAVTNVIRHARASLVTVTLALEDDALRVTIEDDGIGLPLTPTGTGLGLQSMRERATELGGSCVVGEGADGRGTRVLVTLSSAKE